MLELMQWLEVASVKNQIAVNAANSLLCAYLIAYIFNRKAAFIVAFLVSELVAMSSILDSFTDVNFYLSYALIYCLLYFYLINQKERTRTLAAITLVVLVDAGSAINACLFAEVETIFYQMYSYMYVFVHMCVILSLVKWRTLRRIMGAITDAFLSFCGVSYRFSFLCYYLYKVNR